MHCVISKEHRKHGQNITGQDNAPRRAPYNPQIGDDLTHGQSRNYAECPSFLAHCIIPFFLYSRFNIARLLVVSFHSLKNSRNPLFSRKPKRLPCFIGRSIDSAWSVKNSFMNSKTPPFVLVYYEREKSQGRPCLMASARG